MQDNKFSTYLKEQGFNITSKSTKHIEYQEYEIVVEGNTKIIYIPLKESENFDKDVGTLDTISEETLLKILRKFRGIREQK